MRTRFLRGSTQENNNLTLDNGELSIDLEKKAVRLHDGQTLGGFEIVGSPIEFPVPGPDTFQGGDTTAGFYGEVPAEEFITGGDLATAIGLSAGTLQNDTTLWLKFALDNQTLYVPQRTIRHSLSWVDIYQAGVVYGVDGYGSNPSGGQVDQGTIVTIGGNDYRVRLLRGANADPVVGDPYGYDIVKSHGSEWNRLLYPIHSGVHTDTSNPNPHTDPNADPYASWASYSDTDLFVHSNAGSGTYSFTQESTASDFRVYRGNVGVSYLGRRPVTDAGIGFGWRPVLELIE